MAAPPISTINSPRQLADLRSKMLQNMTRGNRGVPYKAGGGNTGGGGRFSGTGGMPAAAPVEAQESKGVSGRRSGGYGGSPRYEFARRPPVKHKPLMPAETGSEVIKRQGGLSPSYGPSGINDLYKKGPVGAWQRLQESMGMAQEGRAADADRLEKAQQLQGMNLEGAQDLRNRVGFNTMALSPTNTTPVSELFPTPENAPQVAEQAQENAANWNNPEAFDPYANEEETDAYAKGGKVTGKAVVGEAGPETKFNQDGTIDQFNKPTLLNNAKPGIIVPNPALKEFLQKFNRPPKDKVGVTPAYAMGGSLGLPAIGSTYGLQPQVIGLSKRGQNAMGGMTTVAGTVAASEPSDEEYYAMGLLPPSRGGRSVDQLQGYSGLPAYAEGGAYDPDAFENNPDNYRQDAQGNTWMRNPDEPNSGILMLRAPKPVNQPMRQFLQSWEDPQNSGIVQNVDAYEQALAESQAQNAQELQAPAVRTPTSITSKYGTGSVSQAPQTSTIEGLPAQEFFQRQANRVEGGANKFARPEADSAYASARKPKASTGSKMNPAMLAQFENWRNAIKRGRL